MLDERRPGRWVGDRAKRTQDVADGAHLIRQVNRSEAQLAEWHADIQFCVDYIHLLNDWEADFLLGVAGYRRPSAKQKDKLAVIIAKIELALTVSSRRRVAR
jgi:hypothetical protein